MTLNACSERKRFSYGATIVLGLLVLYIGSACSVAKLEQRENQDPMIRRARAKAKAQDIDGALELFNKALDRKPSLARAHLELGVLYEDEKKDYIRAIYHYQRYLELRPKSEKRDLIEEVIRRARITFAASLPDTPSGAVEEIAELTRENEMLRAKFAEINHPVPQRETYARRKAPPVSTAVRPAPPRSMAAAPVATPSPAPAQPAVRTYRVQRGDSLSSIASKMYSDSSQWSKIFEANRSTMQRPESIRVGQTLIIPQ